ncbi:MAG: LysR substrate-binding domain-containing protein [Pseudomonadota bacterium]
MQNLNAIPLSALRAVEAIARTGTLGRAANELGVTAGALSQRLAKAEAALGQPLFIREASGLQPTAICQQVAPRLTRAIQDLSLVVSEIRAPKEDMLTISVAPIFASHWLIWRIKQFNQENPSISLRVSPTADIVDLDHSEVDIGIRVGEDPSTASGAVKLLDQRVFPVCSPDMAQRLRTLDDLRTIPIIRENELLYGWESWLSGQNLRTVDLQPGPTYADASLCLDAAMTGQGVFMAWETLACDALEQGHVSSPFARRSATGAAYWFVTSQHSARKCSVIRFRHWLEAELNCSNNHWSAGTV